MPGVSRSHVHPWTTAFSAPKGSAVMTPSLTGTPPSDPAPANTTVGSHHEIISTPSDKIRSALGYVVSVTLAATPRTTSTPMNPVGHSGLKEIKKVKINIKTERQSYAPPCTEEKQRSTQNLEIPENYTMAKTQRRKTPTRRRTKVIRLCRRVYLAVEN